MFEWTDIFEIDSSPDGNGATSCSGENGWFDFTGVTAGRLSSFTTRSPPFAMAHTRCSRLAVITSRCDISCCIT